MKHLITLKNRISTVSLIFICSVCFHHQSAGQTESNKSNSGKTLKMMTYNLKFASPDYKPS